MEGDIRDIETCKKAMEGIDYVSHQAALGSVPRSINDPATSNAVNVSGFLNMLIAQKDSPSVKRLVYAASSSTYGDSASLPKIEDKIGKPLSPYAVTKLVNELYADVFYKTYVKCLFRLLVLFPSDRFPVPLFTNTHYTVQMFHFVIVFIGVSSEPFQGRGTYFFFTS